MLVMFVLSIFTSNEASAAEHVLTKELDGHHWHKGMNAGMMLNIAKDDTTIMQKFITHFLPTIADTTLGERPTHYFFEV